MAGLGLIMNLGSPEQADQGAGLHFDISHLPGWSYIAAGVAAGLLVLLFGRLLSRRPTKMPETVDYSMPNLAPQTPSVPTPGDERRRATRRPGNPTPVLISSDSGEPYKGEVVDRSAGGLCLMVDKQIAKGTVLSVKPAKIPNIPWVKVEVRYCRPSTEGGSIIGCRFVEQPPMNVMLLFG